MNTNFVVVLNARMLGIIGIMTHYNRMILSTLNISTRGIGLNFPKGRVTKELY